ncbi:caprin-2-like, partial [Stegastes partitus]|uniref:Caprin-2-like n=1 Tax=Stegastes partitus TaxID=144197 RepID=A0A9Y4NML1_9TELE
MVQLSPSPTPDVSPPPEHSVEEDEETLEDPAGGPEVGSASRSLQLSLDVSATYHGYETYVKDGLICLKHKVRNLEKKKLKLREYKKRLNRGEALNKDQMVAVEKYDEVVHNLEFARDLHKTLDRLTQNLLKTQKKVVKKEQVVKVEAERRRLTTVLQVQHLLTCLEQEHVRKDLLAGHNQAPLIPAQKLHNLSQLAALLGVKRDHRLSLEKQMEKASLVYLDLLEGKDKPVAGSSFKLLKEDLSMLLNCKFFSCLPPPPSKTPEEQEPPECWDVESPDGSSALQTAVSKPWRGAATFIPKVVPVTSKKQSAHSKQRKETKAKGEQNAKSVIHMDMPVEIFNSPSAFPKDPILRKQHLEDLMTKIHGSFSFMQDSLLDGENSPTQGHPRLKRRPSGSPSPLARAGLRSPADVLPKPMHSTPLPARLMECKASLNNGDQCLETFDQELSAKDLPHEPLHLAERKAFSSPPLYRRESSISVSLEEKSSPRTPVSDSGKQSPSNGLASCSSTPPQGRSFTTPPTRRSLTSTQFQNIPSVFKVNASLPQNGEPNYKPDPAAFSKPMYSTASTQTPPEFAPSEDELQPVYQTDYTLGNGGQLFLSPGQSGGSVSRPSRSYSTRGSVRGGSYNPQANLRDSGPIAYTTR